MIGRTLAHYEITASLGAGGMGEVYRARDTKLKREVAIKVLPAAFIDDAERLARFQREAELLAALNHPNIAQIYGLETLDGVKALVIELVDGPTLDERIAQGPIPVDEALAIAGQIADALEAAHGQGIVHRDLKPANVKLRDDGTVKVLDFGVAKAVPRTATGLQAPALTTPAQTEAGIALGTAAYMSPEQARGKAVDQRADVWGFGCVLYEMLTAQPAFAGEDRTSTLARVLEREIDTSALPGDIPPAVAQTIRLCLEKDSRRRVADIRDVRLALAGTFETASLRAVGARTARAGRAWPLAAAGLIAGALLAWLGIMLLRQPPGPAAPERIAVALPSVIDLFRLSAFDSADLAMSPDGRHVVVVGRADDPDGPEKLWLWSLDQLEPRLLPGTEGGHSPFWSADGSTIAFTAGTALKRIGIDGVSAVSIPNANPRPLGGAWGTWSADDVIVYGNASDGLSRIRPDGSEPALVTEGRTDDFLHRENPVFLPDQRHFLYFWHDEAREAARRSLAGQSGPDGATSRPVTGVYIGDIDSPPGEQSDALLTEARDGPVFVAEPGGRYGHVIYVRNETLIARRFDTERLQFAGDEVPLHSPVIGEDGSNSFTTSRDGRIMLIQTGTARAAPESSSEPIDAPRPTSTLSWVSPDGTSEPLGLEPRDYDRVLISPDGLRIAAVFERSTWLSDLDRPGWTRLTSPDQAAVPFGWSPDSESMLLHTLEASLRLFQGNISAADPLPLQAISASGSDAARTLISIPDYPFSVLWYEPETLIYVGNRGNLIERMTRTLEEEIDDDGIPTESWINIVSLSAEPPLITTVVRRPGVAVGAPAVSPGRDLIAYQSNDSGEIELYVERFPGGGNRKLITNGPERGMSAAWSPAGDELYFRRIEDGAMMAAAVLDASELSFGVPDVLFDGSAYCMARPVVYEDRVWDIGSDGRFLMIERGQSSNCGTTGAAEVLGLLEEQARAVNIIMLRNLIRNLPD